MIWAGFWPVGNTENKKCKNKVAFALKSCIISLFIYFLNFQNRLNIHNQLCIALLHDFYIMTLFITQRFHRIYKKYIISYSFWQGLKVKKMAHKIIAGYQNQNATLNWIWRNCARVHFCSKKTLADVSYKCVFTCGNLTWQ